jgi:hypothetical protein
MKSLVRTSLLLSLFCTGFLRAAEKSTEPAKPAYPLTTCVVSGDKLGEMGKPVEYVWKQAGKPDRVVMFCCKDCIADFEKDPAKYVQKLDAAAAAKAKDAGAHADAKH